LEAKKLLSLPTMLVVVGGVIEAACTIALFGFDEGISRAQQGRIAFLNFELAPRAISDTEAQKIINGELSKLAGGTVVVQSYAMDPESSRLGRELLFIFSKAGLKPTNSLASLTVAGPNSVYLSGIQVMNPGSPDGQNLGLRIMLEIQSATGGRIDIQDRVANVPEVTIFVGLKPLAIPLQ
jgi:hypothetical protein